MATLLHRVAQLELAPGRAASLAFGLVMLAAVGDWITGAAAAFTLFYVLPLAIAVWFVGSRAGLVVATLCVVAGAACDVFRADSHPSWYFIAWNNLAEAGLYFVLAQLLAAVRARVAHEVRQRVEVVDQLRLSERLASAGKLAAGIAQEIRAPLDHICERAAQLSRRAAPDSQAVASEIELQAARIRGVVGQLLNFSRRASAGVQRADLKSLVDETIAILKPIAEQGGVEIIGSGGPVEALFNSAEIQQVVTNLVSNAIEAMPAGGKLEVTTDSTLATVPGRPRGEPAPYARITVRDYGVGISPDALPCIFNPFAAKDGVRSGTPLGLSVSYDIVQEHGGWITVDTRLGEGTSFHVHLPCGY